MLCRSEDSHSLPKFIIGEYESYLRCGIFAHGFFRVECGCCQHEKRVPYSSDRRKSLWDKGCGFCPSGDQRKSPCGTVHDKWRVFAVFDPCTSGWVGIWADPTVKRQTRAKGQTTADAITAAAAAAVQVITAAKFSGEIISTKLKPISKHIPSPNKPTKGWIVQSGPFIHKSSADEKISEVVFSYAGWTFGEDTHFAAYWVIV